MHMHNMHMAMYNPGTQTTTLDRRQRT